MVKWDYIYGKGDRMEGKWVLVGMDKGKSLERQVGLGGGFQ